jgi:hypothetical protein
MIIILVLSGTIMVSFSEYASFYFYSALFQGNAALITFTAMFVIFKRQTLDNKFYQITKIIVDYFKSVTRANVNYGDIFSLKFLSNESIKHLEKSSQERIKELRKSDDWKSRFVELEQINNHKNSLWKNAFPPIFSMLIILIISIILLPFSYNIHQSIIMELFLVMMSISLEIISLLLLFNFIKKTIDYSN